MVSVVTVVRHRVDPVPLTALVAAGDLACIGLFVFGGATQGHGVDPVSGFGLLAETYATFVAGWAITSLLGGLYTGDAYRSVTRAVSWTLPAWVAGAAIAMGIRATPLVHGSAALVFYAVSVAVGLALLVPWRVGVARVASDTRPA